MPLFDVYSRPTFRSLVEAPDEETAEHIALEGILMKYPEGYSVSSQAEPASKAAEADVAKGLRKSDSQACEHCGALHHKLAWGAGFVTCPDCGKYPKTPEEKNHEN